MERKANNVKTIKSDNRALILNHIRRKQVSRADIARLTNLTKSAVTMIISDLIEEGI